MKVKFPVFFKQDGPQFLTFLEFLERNGVKWRTGRLPTDYKAIKRYMNFPVCIFYWDKEHQTGRYIMDQRDFNYITYLNEEDGNWLRENYYFDGEAEFENE